MNSTQRLFLTGFFILALSGGGWAQSRPLFRTGQKADIVLGPFSSRASRSEFHHPKKAFSDGRRLFVSDTRNNRVLIWNSIPTSNGQPPDLVLGQKNFTANSSGGGRSGLNWPVGVFSDGRRLFVADAFNWRVLIWKKIPTANGAPADLVLGQPDFDTVGPGNPSDPVTHLSEPWGVCYDGKKLLIAVSSRVLVWKKLPTRNNQPADLVLGQKNFTTFETNDKRWNLWTPTCVDSDGQTVAVGDYNAKRICLWTKPLTKNAQSPDVVISASAFPEYVQVNKYRYHRYLSDLGTLSLKNGKLFHGCELIWIWESIPTRDNEKYSRFVGADEDSLAGRYYGLQYDGRRIIVADGNNNRVLVYDGIPSLPETPANVVLGATDFRSSVFHGKRGYRSLGGLVSTGKKMAISSFGARAVIYQDLPPDNSRELDTLLSVVGWSQWYSPWAGQHHNNDPFGEPQGLWSDGLKLLLSDRWAGVLLYDRFPERDFQPPYRRLINAEDMRRIGLAQATSACLAGNKLIVLDRESEQVCVWNILPENFRLPDPDVRLRFPPGSMHLASDCATDGRRLAVTLNSQVRIWNTIPVRGDRRPDLILDRLNQPSGVVMQPNLFAVAEVGNNRVLISDRMPKNGSPRWTAVLGQPNDVSALAGKSAGKFNMPARLSFDGEYLWVGEFKWGDRVLGFRANLPRTRPAGPAGLRARVVSNNRVELEWTDNAANERGYLVEYRRAGDAAFGEYGALRFNTAKCSVDGLEKNAAYEFKVTAFNSAGKSPAATASTATFNSADRAPETPFPIFPANGVTDYEPETFNLRWGGGDPDPGDVVSYDVYFGTSQNPPLLSEGRTESEWFGPTEVLPSNATMYWKVVAHDRNGGSTAGSVWWFRTPGIPQDKFTLTLGAAAGGAANYSPGTYEFADMEASDQHLFRIRAYPNAGYSFSGWVGDIPAGHEGDNPLFVPMDRNRRVTPIFAAGGGAERPAGRRR